MKCRSFEMKLSSLFSKGSHNIAHFAWSDPFLLLALGKERKLHVLGNGSPTCVSMCEGAGL